MQDSKLVYFLGLLPAKDMRAFKAYLGAPLFNDREGLKNLLNALEKHFVKGPGTASKEQVYREVYGDKPFKESSLKTSMSQLLKLLREFMAFAQFREDSAAQHRYFLKKLNALGEKKYYPKYHAGAISALEKAPLRAFDRFHELMSLEEEFQAFRDRQPGRDPRDHSGKAVEHLGNGFLLRMLRYQLRILNRKGSFQEGHQSSYLETALGYIEANLESLPLIVKLYHQLYLVQTHPEQPIYFLQVREMLTEHAGDFSKTDANELYVGILNYAARRLNEGDLAFLPRIFELYQEMLQHELIVERGQIWPWHFKNIVNVGLRLGRFAWVEDFIGQWQDKVSPDHAHNAYHYNQGMLHYYQDAYSEAERHFHTLLQDYKDIFYGLNARGYLLQIFYETGNLRGLESLAHSFRMFLDRNKEISHSKRRQYVAFINHLRKLISIPLSDKARLEKLRGEILKKDRKGMGTSWLLDKIGELLGR